MRIKFYNSLISTLMQALPSSARERVHVLITRHMYCFSVFRLPLFVFYARDLMARLYITFVFNHKTSSTQTCFKKQVVHILLEYLLITYLNG